MTCIPERCYMPRMCHTVVLQTPSSVHPLRRKTPEFFHLHVKRLCITYGSMSMDEANIMLSICTGVVDLAFWLSWPEGNSTSTTTVDKPKMSRVISQLPLRHAELPYDQLVEIERQSLSTGSLPGWCTTLTHLEVVYWTIASRDDHILVPLLERFMALTHLAIDWYPFAPDLHEQVDVASFLQTKPLLHIVLVDAEKESVPDDHTPIDIRIVDLPVSVHGEDPVEEWLGNGPWPRRRLRDGEGERGEERIRKATKDMMTW
ncbi:hypothetical protein BKA70DRAFT_1566947 [Coprinopsis sp. MPI-PUGE-AT-0042]|nr:hypothetical protein BKA70DRAFT_1566947 [Coprinopsis sp. MPI-PUGE-AT-0042]